MSTPFYEHLGPRHLRLHGLSRTQHMTANPVCEKPSARSRNGDYPDRHSKRVAAGPFLIVALASTGACDEIIQPHRHLHDGMAVGMAPASAALAWRAKDPAAFRVDPRQILAAERQQGEGVE
jgi:hypothetical protein